MESFNIMSWSDFLSLPVWYNFNFKIGGKSFLDKSYLNRGILCINDFMNECGNFYTQQEFQNKYLFTTNFLQYNNIIHCFRTFLDSLTISHKSIKEVNPLQPLFIKMMNKSIKGCRMFYDTLVYRSNNIISKSKWIRDLDINVLNWKNTYKLPFNILKDTKLQWFQYKINHRILGTNQLLFKMGLRQDDLCTFCASASESILHNF